MCWNHWFSSLFPAFNLPLNLSPSSICNIILCINISNSLHPVFAILTCHIITVIRWQGPKARILICLFFLPLTCGADIIIINNIISKEYIINGEKQKQHDSSK